MEIKKEFDYLHYIKTIRRNVHANPELSFMEYKTQQLIINELKSMGLEPISVGTGVIARLNFGHKKTIAFRADIDALPISETNNIEYISKNNGVMHACGHDGHIAILLSFAKYCSLNPYNLTTNIVFIFQPAEETDGGALSMISAGALNGVDQIFALHVDPSLKAGTYGTCIGSAFSGDYSFDIEFFGESSHCAQPQLGNDALYTAIKSIYNIKEYFKSLSDNKKNEQKEFINSLTNNKEEKESINALTHNIDQKQDIKDLAQNTDQKQDIKDLAQNTDQSLNKTEPSDSDFIFHVGTIHGGNGRNIIADSVASKCTIRYFNKDILESAINIINQECKKISNELKTSYKLIEKSHFIPLVNDAETVEFLSKIVSIKNVERRYTAEDYAFYLEKVKGCMVWLGVNTTENPQKKLHSPEFDFDEQALIYGLELFKKIVKEQKQ